MVSDKLSCDEKPILETNDHIYGFCNKLFHQIKELFDISISPEEVKSFAEANDCFREVVPLAEHICLVMIEAVQNQQARIFGLKKELRLKIANIITVTKSTAFDGCHIPQKQRDQKLYGLAVKFLNTKI